MRELSRLGSSNAVAIALGLSRFRNARIDETLDEPDMTLNAV